MDSAKKSCVALLSPGFSPVIRSEKFKENRFNGFLIFQACSTGVKPGENETAAITGLDALFAVALIARETPAIRLPYNAKHA